MWRGNSWVLGSASFTVAMGWCQRLAQIILLVRVIIINTDGVTISLVSAGSPWLGLIWGNWSFTLRLTSNYIVYILILVQTLSNYFILVVVKHAHMADVAIVLICLSAVVSMCVFRILSLGYWSCVANIMVEFLKARISNLSWHIEPF